MTTDNNTAATFWVSHRLIVITSVQGYCSCGQWGMASDGGLDRLRELHATHRAALAPTRTEGAMTRNRFVYRAEAYYEDPRLDTARNFLTKKARDGWAWRRRRGYPETNTHEGFFSDYKPAIPPAQRVVCRRSKPLEWEPVVGGPYPYEDINPNE